MHLPRRLGGRERQVARGRVTRLAGLIAPLARSRTKHGDHRQRQYPVHGILSVTAVVLWVTPPLGVRFYNRLRRASGVRLCRYPASSVKLSVTSRIPSTISIPPAIR